MKQKSINELLPSLIRATELKQQTWEFTSSKTMFGTFFNDSYIAIDQKLVDVNIYDIYLYDNKGDVQEKQTVYRNIESNLYALADELYQLIIKGDVELFAKYQEAVQKTKEENERRELLTITMSKLSERLLGKSMAERTVIKTNPYFGYVDEKDTKFEMPPLLQIATTEEFTPLHEAEVMVIAAPGATGKTVLSKHLSQYFDFMRLDLGTFGTVGSNSLLGVFADNFESMMDLVNMSVNLQKGKTTMIIDGLDEASLKTTESGFEGFLDDIIKLAKS